MPSRNEVVFEHRAEQKILRRNQVLARINLSKSQLYALIAANQFPAAIRLSARAVGWLESEINNWITERIAASRPSL